jgi:hypothetical protein
MEKGNLSTKEGIMTLLPMLLIAYYMFRMQNFQYFLRQDKLLMFMCLNLMLVLAISRKITFISIMFFYD